MRVFTWDQVQQECVPQCASFPLVIDHARLLLGGCEELYGALVLGSAVFGNARCTSDVDVLVMPKDYYESRRCAVYELHKLQQYAVSLYIIVNPIVVPREDAESGKHTITRSFYQHLKQCAKSGGVIKSDPLGSINLGLQADITRDVIQMLIRKQSVLLNYQASVPLSHGDFAHRLAKILSLARSVCLKLMYTHDIDYEPQGDSLVEDFMRAFPGSRLHGALQALLQAKSEYEQLLLEDASREQYEFFVKNSYFSNIETALWFVRSNLGVLF